MWSWSADKAEPIVNPELLMFRGKSQISVQSFTDKVHSKRGRTMNADSIALNSIVSSEGETLLPFDISGDSLNSETSEGLTVFQV